MPKLSPIRGRELIAILQKIGFQNIHQKGSHVRMVHSDGRKTTIPFHSGEKVGVGLLRKILRFQALGRTDDGRKLFLSLTIRDEKIRVISARDMNKKEEVMYEKA